MTELERRALLGDKQAQEECTKQGIVLPCPKCFNPVEVKKYDDVISVVKCKCGLSYMPVSMEEQNMFPEAWNTRSTPPVGRCGECEHFSSADKNGQGVCANEKIEVQDGASVYTYESDFCSKFEPKTIDKTSDKR